MALYVTDTHPLVWYAFGAHRRLSRTALGIFEDATRGRAFIFVPIVSIWEISLLVRRGRLALREPLEQWATALFAQPGFDSAALDLEVILEASHLHFNEDPFDAAIVAVAKLQDLPLITRDEQITQSGVVDLEAKCVRLSEAVSLRRTIDD